MIEIKQKPQLKLKKKKIHYKIDNIPKKNHLIEDYINKDVKDYFVKTNSKRIEILYLHQHEIGIISNPIVLKTLKKLVKEKKVKYIGVSIYNKRELDFAISSIFTIPNAVSIKHSRPILFLKFFSCSICETRQSTM